VGKETARLKGSAIEAKKTKKKKKKKLHFMRRLKGSLGNTINGHGSKKGRKSWEKFSLNSRLPYISAEERGDEKRSGTSVRMKGSS